MKVLSSKFCRELYETCPFSRSRSFNLHSVFEFFQRLKMKRPESIIYFKWQWIIGIIVCFTVCESLTYLFQGQLKLSAAEVHLAQVLKGAADVKISQDVRLRYWWWLTRTYIQKIQRFIFSHHYEHTLYVMIFLNTSVIVLHSPRCAEKSFWIPASFIKKNLRSPDIVFLWKLLLYPSCCARTTVISYLKNLDLHCTLQEKNSYL